MDSVYVFKTSVPYNIKVILRAVLYIYAKSLTPMRKMN
jgi:hypothetical protein